jgi:hypothetical protein
VFSWQTLRIKHRFTSLTNLNLMLIGPIKSCLFFFSPFYFQRSNLLSSVVLPSFSAGWANCVFLTSLIDKMLCWLESTGKSSPCFFHRLANFLSKRLDFSPETIFASRTAVKYLCIYILCSYCAGRSLDLFNTFIFVHIFAGPGPAHIRTRQQHFLNVKKKCKAKMGFSFFLNGCKSAAYNLNGFSGSMVQ